MFNALTTCSKIINELDCTSNIGNIYIQCQYRKEEVHILDDTNFGYDEIND
jgi:hypothetical protein